MRKSDLRAGIEKPGPLRNSFNTEDTENTKATEDIEDRARIFGQQHTYQGPM